MGRVFPGLNQQTMGLAGIPPSPLVLTDGRGNTLLLHPADDAWAERLAAGALATLGGVCAAAVYCMTGEQARRATIPGSVSLALRLGRAMETEPLSARMSSVCHVLDGGLVHGSATVVGTGSDAGRRVRLEFQSEFLLALEDGAAAAAVPELISVLRSDTCVPIATERLQQGQRVTVLASPALEPWRSDEGMTMVGPAAFGYDVELDSRRGEHLDA
jgi:DUF917 family protein